MKITFSTSHGDFKISKWNFNLSLIELCKLNKIPHHSVSFYGKKGTEYNLIVGLHNKLGDLLALFNEVILKPDRNIDYLNVVDRTLKIKKNSNPVSEYSFPSTDGNELHHFEFSQLDCLTYVTKKVTEFLANEVKIDPLKKIVLGISGGGDSNTLIASFIKSGLVNKAQLIGVMMLGIPDWDLGRSRAEEICKDHDIEFQVVDPKTMNFLLGKPLERDWVEDFENIFPDADLEVLGTHCIKLALKHIANEVNAQAVVTGLNLEDILAECFLTTIKGVLPPPFPIRRVDGLEFWHPLYKIPKKIIDGCYPKYSFQNYQERFPSRMIGRAIPYYLSQSMHTLIPGVEFDLLEGFKKLSDQNLNYGYNDTKLGFMTSEPIENELKSKWKRFIEHGT